MPLTKGKSKHAFESNLKTELEAGKPKKQALAIAYSVKRKAPKKMYQGGTIDADSRDSDELGMLHGHESFGKSSVDKSANEEGMVNADSLTSEEMDMIRRHRMAKGGEVPNFHDEGRPNADSGNARDGEDMLESHPTMHSRELDWTDEGRANVDSNDSDDNRDEDMLDGHPTRHKAEKEWASDRPSADSDDDDDQKDTDMVSQIMAKRKSSESMDMNPTLQEAMTGRSKYAKGGEVDEDEPDLQYNNGDEHLNKEDQLSFDAARKKTYYDEDQLEDQPEDSNEHGDDLEDEDSHDMVGMIRKKMKMRKVGQ